MKATLSTINQCPLFSPAPLQSGFETNPSKVIEIDIDNDNDIIASLAHQGPANSADDQGGKGPGKQEEKTPADARSTYATGNCNLIANR